MKIELVVKGYEDCFCVFLREWGHREELDKEQECYIDPVTKSPLFVPIFNTDYRERVLWESSWFDNHPEELEYSMRELREEIIEIFEELDLDINDIEDFDEDCIWDWEYEQEL